MFKLTLIEAVNNFTLSSVIRVCGNSTLLKLGKQIHESCLKMNYDSSNVVGSPLISFFIRNVELFEFLMRYLLRFMARGR